MNVFILDSEPEMPYAMAYPAICEYADPEASAFNDFNVPQDPILELDDKGGVLSARGAKPDILSAYTWNLFVTCEFKNSARD